MNSYRLSQFPARFALAVLLSALAAGACGGGGASAGGDGDETGGGEVGLGDAGEDSPGDAAPDVDGDAALEGDSSSDVSPDLADSTEDADVPELPDGSGDATGDTTGDTTPVDATGDPTPDDSTGDAPASDAGGGDPEADAAVDSGGGDGAGADGTDAEAGGDAGGDLASDPGADTGPGSCDFLIPIDCGTSRYVGDTADGTALFNDYCDTWADYEGREVAFEFQTDVPVEALIEASSLSSDFYDFDLAAFDGTGGGCDESLACLRHSASTGATEGIILSVAPGERVILVWDVYDDAGATAPFELDVLCDPQLCGDGEYDYGEECDDGNTLDGDGCAGDCLAFEPGFVCDTWAEPMECRPIVCGDGITDEGEECDDGAASDGDGCSGVCGIEAGWRCAGSPSNCIEEWRGETCLDAIPIESGSFTFSTSEYASDAGGYLGECGATPRQGAGADMFFAVTVPANGVIAAALESSFDGVLALASECPDIANSCLVWSDPGSVRWENLTGSDRDIFIVVDGWATSSDGDFTLTTDVHAIACGDGRIEGDEECDDGDLEDADGCSSACTVELDWACFGEPSSCFLDGQGDTCEVPIRIEPGTLSFSTTGFEPDYDAYLGLCSRTGAAGGGADVVFVLSVPPGQTAIVTLDGLYDEVLALSTECPDVAGGCVAWSDPGAARWTNPMETAVDLFIVADGYSAGSSGDFTLEVEMFDPWSAPAGATCQNPIELGPGSYNYDTTDGFDVVSAYPACGVSSGRTGPEQVFSVVVPAGETLWVDVTTAGGWDAVLALSTDCPDVGGSCQVYEDDPELAGWTNEGPDPVTVFVTVDGYGSYSFGPFSIRIDVSP